MNVANWVRGLWKYNELATHILLLYSGLQSLLSIHSNTTSPSKILKYKYVLSTYKERFVWYIAHNYLSSPNATLNQLVIDFKVKA